MTALERNAIPNRGPHFFREGDGIMFEFVIDPTNVIGPRPVKERDTIEHGEAWGEFLRSASAEPSATVEAQGKPPEAAAYSLGRGDMDNVEAVGPGAEPNNALDNFDADMRSVLAGTQAAFNGADPAKFDHDNDGQPGGSKPHAQHKPRGPYKTRKGHR